MARAAIRRSGSLTKTKATKPLASYRSKRNFAATPEPRGRMRRARQTMRFFCVQKHLASHLHYDLRLEHGGVLLSWAVPKGPSLDPNHKRLAMAVEDHPREYGDFEGVIPSGYGAGIVMLWDRGVWQPLVDDVDAAVQRGKLPFLVHAEKLTGAWSLVRLARGGPRSWLLMKQRDAWADERDVTRTDPLSVASGADFPGILASQPAWPWPGKPPVSGGETGALFRTIMSAAAQIRAREKPCKKPTPRSHTTKRTRKTGQ